VRCLPASMGLGYSQEPLIDTSALRGRGIHKSDLVAESSQSSLAPVYELGRVLGRGTFGVVYQATHRKTRQYAVCKVIERSKTPDLNAIRNEIAMVKTLDHPHILRIFDVFEHGGPSDPAFYMICEECTGGDLQAEMAQNRRGFPTSLAAKYVRQVLLAMNYCHSLAVPVMHRDLKPANLMKIGRGTFDIKVIDFGLANLSQVGASAEICGTPEFMAPEVWTGRYGHEVDCWSIGMLLYYFMVGSLPFRNRAGLDYAKMWKSWKLEFYNLEGWAFRPRSSRDLLRNLLKVDARGRMSAGSALKSEFIKKYGKSRGYTGAIMDSMKQNYSNFTSSPKLVEGLKTFAEVPRVMRVVLLLSASKMDVGEMAQMRRTFDSIDRDHDGFISEEDMKNYLNGFSAQMGQMAAALKQQKLTASKTDTDLMLKLADLDEDGAIGFSEFLVVWMYTHRKQGESLLRQAFDSIKGADGLVSREDIRKALCSTQMQQIGTDQQLATEIAAIFPKSVRMDFSKFQEFLQRQEDLGEAGSLEFALRSKEGSENSSWWGQLLFWRNQQHWRRLGTSEDQQYEDDASDIDMDRHSGPSSLLSICCCCEKEHPEPAEDVVA